MKRRQQQASSGIYVEMAGEWGNAYVGTYFSLNLEQRERNEYKLLFVGGINFTPKHRFD